MRAPLLVAATVALLLAADLVVTEVAEGVAARGLERTLCGDASVDLDGWPVSARLVLGRIPHAHAEVVGAQPARLDAPLGTLTVDADDVRLDGTRLASLGSGTFTATVTGDGLTALIDLPVLVDRVEVTDGRVVLHARGLQVPAVVTLEEDVVVVAPALGPAVLTGLALRVPLDDLPAGTAVTGIEVGEDVLTVTGTLEGADLVSTPRTTPCPGGPGPGR